jgi:hypothetical protein
MKFVVFFGIALTLSFTASSQSFPQNFIGHWKGELLWYQSPGKEPKKMNMELHVLPTDSSHKFSWQMIYGSPTQDNRPYTLIAKDTANGHWMVDENNGIVLDQYWIAGRLSGMFTVQSSTIINNYWIQDGKVHVEFYNVVAKPIATTGKGDKEIPFVDSYQVRSYQKAVLTKQ